MEKKEFTYPIITNSDDLTEEKLASIADLLKLAPQRRQLLSTLIRLTALGKTVDVVVVSKAINKSIQTTRVALKRLSDDKFLRETKTATPKGGRGARYRTIYNINYPSAELQSPSVIKVAPRSAQERIREDLTGSSNHRRGDSYITGLMSTVFPSLPYSQKDTTTKKREVINTNYGKALLEVRSTDGYSIARVKDLAVWVALLGYCLQLVKKTRSLGSTPVNNFSMHSSHEIVTTIGRIEKFTAILKRLSNSKIEIVSMPDNLLKKWNISEASTEFEFLNSLSVYKLTEGKRSPYGWTFSLPADVFDTIVRKAENERVNLFLVNPEILSEESSIVVGLHLYFRRLFSGSTDRVETTLDRLHKDIAPSLTRKQFVSALLLALPKLKRREEQYFIENRVWKRTKSVALDPDDPFNRTIEPSMPFVQDEIDENGLPTEFSVEVYGYSFIKNNNGRYFIKPESKDFYIGEDRIAQVKGTRPEYMEMMEPEQFRMDFDN